MYSSCLQDLRLGRHLLDKCPSKELSRWTIIAQLHVRPEQIWSFLSFTYKTMGWGLDPPPASRDGLMRHCPRLKANKDSEPQAKNLSPRPAGKGVGSRGGEGFRNKQLMASEGRPFGGVWALGLH